MSSDMSGVQNSLNSVLNSMNSMNSTLSPLASNVSQLVEILTEVKIILTHWHNMHRALLPTPITPAEKLIQEYNTGYDIDYNGIIYGKDFKLIDSDDVPRMVREVNKLLDDSKYNKISFNQYLTSVPNYAKVWYL